MGRARIIGTAGAREITRGRPPQNIGVPVGQANGTRVVYAPPVGRKANMCEGTNKRGQPCKAPKAKGKDFCIGHQAQMAAHERKAG